MPENPGSPLPRFVDLEGLALRRAQVVVLHHPREEGAGVMWTLSLTDLHGRPLAREHLRLPAGQDPPLRAIAQRYLYLIGMCVDGEWVSSDESGSLRHFARIVRCPSRS